MTRPTDPRPPQPAAEPTPPSETPRTLKEIAALAGAHPSTVSRVINGDSNFRIAAATRARIEAVVRESGYQPNALARALRLKRAQGIAVIVPDITNPAFAMMFRGVEEAALVSGTQVFLCNTDSAKEREAAHIRSLLNGRADGLILADAVLNDPNVAGLRDQGFPHVLVSRYSDLTGAFVGVDELTSAIVAVEHLIELGHRRIAHLGGPAMASTALLRRKGYHEALTRAGIKPDPALEYATDWKGSEGYQGMVGLLELESPPTAVFAVTDRVAIGALEACQEHGIRVPEDVSIVGFNDIGPASYVRPKLTTIRVPYAEVGRVATEHLLARMSAADAKQETWLELPTELIVRGSTAAPRAEQPVSERSSSTVARLPSREITGRGA